MGREMFEANRVGYVALWTDRLAATRDTLAAALNLSVRFEDDALVVFAMEGTDFVLRATRTPNDPPPGAVRVGFYADDLDAATERLRAMGLPLDMEKQDIGAGQRVTSFVLNGGDPVEIVGR